MFASFRLPHSAAHGLMNRSLLRFGRMTFLILLSCLALAGQGGSADRARGAMIERGGDEVVLINTRGLGSARHPDRIAGGLRCERLVRTSRNAWTWTAAEWTDVLLSLQRPLPTVVFVHGNRVERGEDRAIGLSLYRTIDRYADADSPKRLVIWSWPTSQIRGPVRDFKLKSARAASSGWQLAWVLDQLPDSSPKSLLAYSLGARVVTGALHVLGGGELGGATLPTARSGAGSRLNAVLVSAAVNADWLRPGGPHGNGLSQVHRLFITTNRADPAMRFYRFGPTGRGAQALGYVGPLGMGRDPAAAARIIAIDATQTVGRSHELDHYLLATPLIDQLLHDIATGAMRGGAEDRLGRPVADHAAQVVR